jgi:hypothetical protein
MGQLLVVARHTVFIPSSCYELGLIPDPSGSKFSYCLRTGMMDLGSDVVAVGIDPL